MVKSARDRRKHRKTLAAIALVVVAGIVVGGLIWLRISVAPTTALDGDTLCPKDGPTAFTVLLIDGTDAFSPIQRADIQRNLEALANHLENGEQLTVFAPTETQEASFLSPVFQKCSPGTDADVSGFTQNPRQIQLRYERGFRDQLERTLRHGLSTTDQASSPIMRMIQAATIKGDCMSIAGTITQ